MKASPSRPYGHAVVKGARTTQVASSYVTAFLGGETELIPLIRSGVPAIRVLKVAGAMGRPKEKVYKILRLSRATVERKGSLKQLLSPEQSERVIGLERLIGQVQVMVEESGNPKGFDAAVWVADWIERPLPALGGVKPADYLDTMAGQQLVSRILTQMQSGAFA